MDAALLTDYVESWVTHPLAGTPEGKRALDRLTAFMSPTVRYEDVPSAVVFDGHAGIAQMCTLAHEWSADLRFNILSQQTDGKFYAFETEAIGTNTGAIGPLPATGRSFVLRGVSVGTVGDDGLVVEQRDYWDLGSFLRQIGILPE